MALDAGDVEAPASDLKVLDDLAPLRPTRVVLETTGHVGAALRKARESLDLDVDDIALATRVRAAHLTALEAFDMASLPARPFAIGYVRAYALALGLDPDTVVARFRFEAPAADGTLRPPGGLGAHPSQWRWLIMPASAIMIALVSWNLVQHNADAPARPTAPVARAPGAARDASGPTRLGPPLPAPVEAGAPPVYVTPGLEPADAAEPSAASTSAIADGAPFVAGGAIFGAAGPSAGPASGTILQARKPTSFIVRGPAGTVVFARELAAGEAWRASADSGLTVDVGDPTSVEVYVGGLAKGALVGPLTPLAKLPGLSIPRQ